MASLSQVLCTATCPSCRLETVIRLEMLVGRIETFAWHCLRCHAHWSVAALPALGHSG
jgi:hypothetical protein